MPATNVESGDALPQIAGDVGKSSPVDLTVHNGNATVHSTPAKQDPAGKNQRMAAADGKVYFSYAQIHDTVSRLVDRVKEFDPDVIIAIGGGGFIPARMLRTQIRKPILAISLELYDDDTGEKGQRVKKVQWFDETSGVGKEVRGKRVLIMDEVDDTRTTLKYCVEEVMETNAPAAIAVAVVHNKLKPKEVRGRGTELRAQQHSPIPRHTSSHLPTLLPGITV
jgi:hypoxanthine phosphoribosyltransferase